MMFYYMKTSIKTQLFSFKQMYLIMLSEKCHPFCSSLSSLDVAISAVKIGSGNGLVPSGNKPLPEPMLMGEWDGGKTLMECFNFGS